MNDNFTVEIKPFNALTPVEVYKILQLRNEVFIVEQNIVYLDSDNKDFDAEHVMIWNGEDLAAYARIFKEGAYFEDGASIGRVIVNPKYRRFGLGHQLIKQCLVQIEQEYEAQATDISAQEYLQKFYETHGFVKTSESYIEEGISHIHMKRVH